MKKGIKALIVIVVTLLVCYVGLVVIDCIRLQIAKFDTKPLITISEELECFDQQTHEYYNKYKGLGYSITYSYYIDETSAENNIGVDANGAEFRLFDKIMIWAWIE